MLFKKKYFTLVISSLFMIACDPNISDKQDDKDDAVYLWKKITFANISQSPALFVNNDNNYAYIYDNKELYVSYDKGKNWDPITGISLEEI